MPIESWISADIYQGFLDWESEVRVSCLREWSNSKVQTTPYRGKKREESPKQCHLRLETKDPCELLKPVMIHRTRQSDRDLYGSLLFLHRTILHVKQTVKMAGLRFFQSDRTIRFGFQNHSWFEVIILSSIVATFWADGIIFSLPDFDLSWSLLLPYKTKYKPTNMIIAPITLKIVQLSE